MQTQVVHLRLSGEDIKTLDSFGEVLSRQAVAVLFLHAALEAVRENPDSVKFPPVFAVVAAAPDTTRMELNDGISPPIKRRTK